MKLLIASTLVLVSLASVAGAHTTRSTSALARLDALNMPGLAPARSLMAEMLDDLEPPRRRPAIAEVPTRRWGPLHWFWSPAPLVILNDSHRCEVIYTPYAGRIETCMAPLRSPARVHPMPYDPWLESR